MGISFGKRKVKIKLLGQSETVTEEEKPKVPVPIYQPETVSKARPKVNRTFKEACSPPLLFECHACAF
ncbi:MAG: hypothetical protein IJ192_11385 [Clostridia bacterium]|nr:hypothetical protein [Clostridia bacterium]MBR2177323.1 hypothetical protein [Clostridia bacterium]